MAGVRGALAGFNRIIKKCPKCGEPGPKELVGTDKHLMALCPKCQHVFHPYRRWGCGTVAIIAVGIIAIWSMCTHREDEAPADSAPPAVSTAPRPSTATTPAKSAAAPILPNSQLAAASRAAAIKKYPDLAKKDSPLNAAFVARYKAYQTNHSDILTQPDWPLILAERCAKELGITPVE